jgi:hypothetical protein
LVALYIQVPRIFVGYSIISLNLIFLSELNECSFEKLDRRNIDYSMSNHHNRTNRVTQKRMLLIPLVLQNRLQYYKHDMKVIDAYVQVNKGS